MVVKVYVPSLFRALCGERSLIEVPAGTFDQVLRAVDDECSGFRDRLLENGELRPELAVAIDGEMVPLALHEPISDGSELAVVPAIGGG